MTVTVRDADSGRPRFPPIRPVLEGGPLRSMAVSADSRLLATAVNGRNAVQVWDLTTGKFEGDIVTCPRHGWIYNVRTGDCLTHESTRLRRYGLKVEGDDVFITLLPIEEN